MLAGREFPIFSIREKARLEGLCCSCYHPFKKLKRREMPVFTPFAFSGGWERAASLPAPILTRAGRTGGLQCHPSNCCTS